MTEDTLPTEEASVVDAFINYDGHQPCIPQLLVEEGKENVPRCAEVKAIIPVSSTAEPSTNVDDERLYNLAAALVSFSSQSFPAEESKEVSFEEMKLPETCCLEDDDGPIQAYAKIEGDGWVYFVKRPSCVFGKAPTTEMQ